jgi:hypothetical protein
MKMAIKKMDINIIIICIFKTDPLIISDFLSFDLVLCQPTIYWSLFNFVFRQGSLELEPHKR